MKPHMAERVRERQQEHGDLHRVLYMPEVEEVQEVVVGHTVPHSAMEVQEVPEEVEEAATVMDITKGEKME